MAKGIKISKNRKDVNRADSIDLVLDSESPGSLKVAKVVELTIIAGYVGGSAEETEVSYPHEMGYTPAFYATVYIPEEGETFPMPYDINGQRQLKVSVDNTNIYATAVTLESGKTYRYRVIVFAEKMVDA